jgi:hypothetical protein
MTACQGAVAMRLCWLPVLTLGLAILLSGLVTRGALGDVVDRNQLIGCCAHRVVLVLDGTVPSDIEFDVINVFTYRPPGRPGSDVQQFVTLLCGDLSRKMRPCVGRGRRYSFIQVEPDFVRKWVVKWAIAKRTRGRISRHIFHTATIRPGVYRGVPVVAARYDFK